MSIGGSNYGTRSGFTPCAPRNYPKTWHFPKIHRSVLHKIIIDLLYFWDANDAIYEKNNSAEVQLIYAEEISLNNFINLRKKTMARDED